MLSHCLAGVVSGEEISYSRRPGDCDYCRYDYVGKAADLYTLQKMAIRQLPTIQSKTLTILSKADQSVPFKEKALIDRLLKAPNEYVILEKSSHIVTDDVEREIVAQRIVEFLGCFL